MGTAFKSTVRSIRATPVVRCSIWTAVIGINGRGSFQDRGRVNVGLGYAISANQIKNFIPDLLATKLVEHGTLDANFSERDGKVVCSTINELRPWPLPVCIWATNY